MNDLLILLLVLAVWIFVQAWLLPQHGCLYMSKAGLSGQG